MTNIVIKDLTESLELDSEAMRQIVGGARPQGAGAHNFNRQTTLQKCYPSVLDNIIGNEKLRSMTPPELS